MMKYKDLPPLIKEAIKQLLIINGWPEQMENLDEFGMSASNWIESIKETNEELITNDMIKEMMPYVLGSDE